jgi:serine acetyltransferase
VRVRRGATVGLAATLMGDVEVGEGAVVLPHSVLLPGSRVGAGETWGGVPARPIGNDERERFRRLVQGIEEGEARDQ